VIYLLDTNILIYLIKNHPPAVAQRVDAMLEDDRLCMSFITWAELLKGAERSTRKPEVLRALDNLARQVPVIYPSAPAICRHYAVQASRHPHRRQRPVDRLPRAGRRRHLGDPQHPRVPAG
jgi:tRNA(fMet)-specific endonuclease VapC